MARIRTIKPECWTDGDVVDLPPQARLLFIGSWNFAMCDYGHLADDARRLKMQVLPDDDTMMVRDESGAWVLRSFDANYLVELIVAAGRFDRLDVDGDTYLWIKRFERHQKLERRWTPRCVACKALGGPPEELSKPRRTSREVSRTPRTSASEGTGQEGTSAAAAAGDAAAAALPGRLAILQSKLQAHTPLRGLRFDTLTDDQVDRLAALVELHGDDPLVTVAIATCRNPAPTYVTAFLGTWEALPPPGRPLHVVKQQLCDIHSTPLSPTGVCSSCASDLKAGNR